MTKKMKITTSQKKSSGSTVYAIFHCVCMLRFILPYIPEGIHKRNDEPIQYRQSVTVSQSVPCFIAEYCNPYKMVHDLLRKENLTLVDYQLELRVCVWGVGLGWGG